MNAMKFNLEVRSVVAMRLMKIAAGGTTGTAEGDLNKLHRMECVPCRVLCGTILRWSLGWCVTFSPTGPSEQRPHGMAKAQAAVASAAEIAF
jgi:hypothetical protein